MDTNFKTINATKSISEGFRLAGINWGLNIAFLIVLFMIGGMVGFIPIVSQFYSSLVAPILMFGYGIVAYAYSRNERVEFGDYFKGFNNFGPMVLTTLGMMLASLVAFLPLLFYILDAMGGFSGIIDLITSFSDPMEASEAMERMGENLSQLSIPLVIVLGLLFLVPTFLFSFSLYFVWYKQSAP